jgi:hypothetical protein
MRVLRKGARFAALISAAAACSSDKLNNNTVVMPTKPTGYVAGEVVGATTDLPMPAVTVSLEGGGLMGTVTTDEKGSFGFGPISAGAAFSLHVSQDAMADATLTDLMIADAAGNFPTGNGALWVGPIGLIPLTGKFSVQVVSAAGNPVSKAQVTMETGVRFLLAGTARSTFVGSATTDQDGLATVANLPDLRALPPSLTDAGTLVINVAPVDIDGDGKPDLRGSTLVLTGQEVRDEAATPVIVLDASGTTTLSILASNVPRLAIAASVVPGVLDAMDPVRVVFNQAIDRMSVAIDLRDESGQMMVPNSFVIGTLGNIMFITPTMPFDAGREYNLSFRVVAPDAGKPQTLTAAAPFFSKVDLTMPITLTARFHDANGDQMWGNSTDDFELTWSIPIGRAGQSPAFHARLWVDLDLDASGRTGDGAGELPPMGLPYPTPLMVAAAEPSPPNGAGLSGFTRNLAGVPILLMTPRAAGQGPVNYEVHVAPEDNGGAFVTDVSGRAPPLKLTGQAILQ